MLPRLKLPDNIRLVNVLGMDYFIQWEDLPRGGSFFMPTTATPAQVLVALRPHREHFNFTFEARARCEYGLYGVRVWRTS